MGLHYSFTEITVTSDSDPTLDPIILPLNATSEEIQEAVSFFFDPEPPNNSIQEAANYLEQTLSLPTEQATTIIQQIYEMLLNRE